MATFNYDYSFTPNTAAKATEVNGNFNKVKQFAEDISSGINIDAGAITTAKVADAAVTTAKLSNASVTTDKLVNSSVTTDKIANNSVTAAKLPANNFMVTYQDFTVTVDPITYPYGQNVMVNLSGGLKNYQNVIGVTAWGATNSNATIENITLGQWVGVQDSTQVKVWVLLGNNVASNNVNIRVWLV